MILVSSKLSHSVSFFSCGDEEQLPTVMSDSVQDLDWSLYLHAWTLQLIFWFDIYIIPFYIILLAKYENLYIGSKNTLNNTIWQGTMDES